MHEHASNDKTRSVFGAGKESRPSRGRHAVIRFPNGAIQLRRSEAGGQALPLKKHPQDINLVVDMTAWREGTGT
jgi:hypothetical protein